MLGGPTEGAVKVNWPLAILASVAIHAVFIGALLFYSGHDAPATTLQPPQESAQPSEPAPEPAVEPNPPATPQQPSQASSRNQRASGGSRGASSSRGGGNTRNSSGARNSNRPRTPSSTNAPQADSRPTQQSPAPRANAGDAKPAVAAQGGTEVAPSASVTPPAPQPSHTSPQDASSEVEFYTVKRGDSLTKIAKREGCSVSDLAKLNGFPTDKMLNVGQRIKLPKAER